MNFSFKKIISLIIIPSLLLLLHSCNLRASYYDENSHNNQNTSDKSSSLIANHYVKGIALGNDGKTIYAVSSEKSSGPYLLRKKVEENEWVNITNTLPEQYINIYDIVQINSNIYILSNKINNNINYASILKLNPTDSSFSLIAEQEKVTPLRFIKNVNIKGEIESAYVHAKGNNKVGNNNQEEIHYIYELPLLKEINPFENINNKSTELPLYSYGNSNSIIGVMEGNAISNKEQVRFIYTKGLNSYRTTSGLNYFEGKTELIKNLESNKKVYAVGTSQIGNQNSFGIAVNGGDFFKLEIEDSVNINKTEGYFVKGISANIIPTFLSYIDGIPIMATQTGYFENKDGISFSSPSLTSNSTSYNANKMNTFNIYEIYNINSKTYMLTNGKGLWERNTYSKEWNKL